MNERNPFTNKQMPWIWNKREACDGWWVYIISEFIKERKKEKREAKKWGGPVTATKKINVLNTGRKSTHVDLFIFQKEEKFTHTKEKEQEWCIDWKLTLPFKESL